MRERYVRPPLVPREAPPPWLARWRFRSTALALIALLLVAAYLGFEHFSGAASQDPGLSSLSRLFPLPPLR